MNVATPMNRTNGCAGDDVLHGAQPNADACATRARATIAPVNVVRNIPARLNDSFQASERDASKLQCSVDKIWSRIDGDASAAVVASLEGGAGAGSTPSPVPPPRRSKDILALSSWSSQPARTDTAPPAR